MSRPALSDEWVAAAVRDAVAAPSMHNAQPWRFRYLRRTRAFEVWADFERTMPHSDPDTRGVHLGCGAALLNLRTGIAHAGWHPETRLLPDLSDKALLASVRLVGRTHRASGLSVLYPAIRQRHSSRHPFEERQIPEAVRESLRAAARAEGVTLTFPDSWHLREVLELVQEAEARNITDPGSDQDLARWTRTDAPSVSTADDGVPHYAFGPRKRGGRAPMRDFAGPRQVAGRDAADFEQNPQLALISTDHDRPEDWLRAGQAMERVLLLATREGLASSFVTQPLEWTDLRWPLRDPMTGTGYTQVLLRLGYGPNGPGAPRRPVSEVLDIEA
ncbi:nitroreductase family protein [Streptomyces sp. ME02-8801-2C]|uniref:Acg family FMN-binding oxidoreductase n=1 Tax=Streptomyces sp. ME02-8801-2C TaxID=3028680 RepID=UPI0029B7FE3D|nr:nitroreductase family protein [Streptomyces sp. ME02-8801-2C]MDX3451719.1 nitroreductase family protein [Streptomyces sp. ME02-8801-2C]